MTLRFEDVRVRDDETIDRTFFNRRLRLIVEDTAALRARIEAIDAATDNLITLGLTKVNEALGPALAQAQAAAENGFLVATSSTALTLSETLETTFEIDDTPARALFSATPYVVVTRSGATLDDWAVFRVDSYDRDTGGLAGEVVSTNGNIGAGEYDDWIISATAGLAASLIEAMATMPGLIAAAEAAQQAAEDAAAAAETVLESGPVASVNGQTGVVSIGMSDIAGLVTALAGKAALSHAHTIAQVNGLQAALDALTAADAALTASLSVIDGGTY